MNKLSTWLVVIGTTILLFGGIAAFYQLIGPINDNSLKKISEGTPLTLFLAVGLPICFFEALCFTVASIELGAKLTKSTLVGGLAGIITFGVVYHWFNGALAILVSSWIALVLNSSYIVLRKHSRKIATASTMVHKFIFFCFATFNIYI